jgi:hypothetical protein
MGTPGFVAEYSLYTSKVHYYAAAALAQAAGATLQDFSLPVSRRVSLREVPLAPSGRSCDPLCLLDETGACVRNCIYCTPHQPIDECQEFTEPCNSCCPSGRDPCYAPHKARFCCPPGEHCCDSQTNFCCAEQCCFDAGYYCCRDSEYCCGGACCPQGSACCNGNCTPLGTDQNCSGCGDDCRTSTSGKKCVGGQCVCPPGLSPCGNSCCPSGACCNGVCCPGMGCCNGNCTPLGTDQNCSGCGDDCKTGTTGKKCAGGQCVCPPGLSQCGNSCCTPEACCNGVCTNVKGDPNNCGRCGLRCAKNGTCVDGRCKCISPLIDCNGVCLDVRSDPNNCGTCGHACMPGQMCSNGSCFSMPPGGGNPCGIYRCNDSQFCCLSDDGREGVCCDFAMWSGCEGATCAYLH